jgi:DNA-directed RNA polymerase subunit RPC12/RpoP
MRDWQKYGGGIFMSESFSYVLFAIVIVLMIVNWIIYHRIFSVMYFDLGRGLLKEFIVCFFAAILEISAIVLLFKYVGKIVLKILGVTVGIVKVLLILILGLGLVVAGICVIKAVYNNKEKIFSVFKKETFDNSSESTATRTCQKCGKEFSEGIFCPECGTRVEIEEKEKNSG